MRHPTVRAVPLWIVSAALYYGLARVSAHGGLAARGVPLVMLAQGVAYAAVQRGGPWLALAVAAGAAAEGFQESRQAVGILLFAAAAAGSGLAAWAVTKRLNLRVAQNERLGDTLIRLLSAVAGSLVGASFFLAADLVARSFAHPVQHWGVLFLANLAGIVAAAPALRVWVERTSLGVAGHLEWIALISATIGLSIVVGTGLFGDKSPTAYFLFPVVVWAALRAGRMGVSAVVFIFAVAALESTSAGHGPFVATTLTSSAVALNSFLLVLGVTGLFLVALEQERRQTESGLTETEARYRALIDRLPLVAYENRLDDPDAPPSFTSRRVETLLGYPHKRWLQEPRFAATLVHPEDREANAELNARAVTEDFVQGEYRMIRADGRVIWVLDQMAVVRDERGKAIVQQGFVVDISERKALEEQLGRAQRLEALGLLAGGIAHDFNNLLTAISGYTGLALEHGGSENERIRSDLREVKTAAARAAELTRQLLAFGRRQVLERTVIDLNEVVVEAQSLLDRVLGEHVIVVTKLEPQLMRVHADAGQIGQVLLNLAVNARDAMPKGGTMTIETWNDGENAVIAVSDTGYGMDATTRARIFEPFYSTKPIGEGTGLGLAMAHGIVRQTGGEISVESEPGAGAVFRIVLPGTDELPDVAAVHVPASPRGAETILLVEDEDIVRRLVAEMLRGQGYTVVTAAGPLEALEIAQPYDLLLTDVVMPGMSGPDLAERLVERRAGIAVLFTSGYSGAAVADRSTLRAALLEKPFTIEQLAAKVREALDARVASLG